MAIGGSPCRSKVTLIDGMVAPLSRFGNAQLHQRCIDAPPQRT
ncbi:hypothetical protein ACS15_4640 [Ralstonia insidiosa]|uniref:Uncharacterized protein n=1 Tax=Ralstonia insidiosa TaxID=190721 RepID=A0AAC9BMR1_9RALS|nr:hypothetical protein ACS15_4640 [Ralstonia insidiosa]